MYNCRDNVELIDVFRVVVRLSQHRYLTFLLDNCRDKFIIVAENVQLIPQVLFS